MGWERELEMPRCIRAHKRERLALSIEDVKSCIRMPDLTRLTRSAKPNGVQGTGDIASSTDENFAPEDQLFSLVEVHPENLSELEPAGSVVSAPQQGAAVDPENGEVFSVQREGRELFPAALLVNLVGLEDAPAVTDSRRQCASVPGRERSGS